MDTTSFVLPMILWAFVILLAGMNTERRVAQLEDEIAALVKEFLRMESERKEPTK